MLVALLMGHVDLADGSGSHADGGGHGGHDGGHGHGDSHGAYGVKGEGHGHAEAGAFTAPTFHFPFFSPLALATLFGAIGAWGLIAKQGLGADDPGSLMIAVPAALVTTYLVTYAGWRLAQSSRGSSQIRNVDLEGAIAEVITPIPAGGMGEVAAMVNGQRFNGAARAADGGAVPRGAVVRVQALVGGTLIVQKKEG